MSHTCFFLVTKMQNFAKKETLQVMALLVQTWHS
jgi:hypothetical protein